MLPDLPDLDRMLDPQDPAASEAAWRELLPVARQHGLDAELCLLTRIARAQGMQGHFDEAQATLDEVEARSGGANREVVVRMLVAEGAILRKSALNEAAAAFFEDAYGIAIEHGLDELAIDAAILLGEVLPPDPALEWLMVGIGVAERSARPVARGRLPSLLQRTESALRARGDEAHADQVRARLAGLGGSGDAG